MQDPNKDIENLFLAEYGEPGQIIVRILGVGGGGAMLYAYSGWAISWIWPLVFLAVHVVQWTYLNAHRGTATRRHVTIGAAMFVVVHAAFMWLPAYIAAQPEPGLILIGCFATSAAFLYHIYRADTVLWLIWVQVIVFGLTLGSVLVAQLPRLEDPILRFAAVMIAILVLIYLAMTMLAIRRSRLSAMLAAERLAQDQKMAAIGRLAGGVAHDFNNILTVVQGNLELYDLLETEAEKQAAIAEARMAAKRAEMVIKHLLIYARKAPLRQIEVDANTPVREALALARTMVPERIALRSTLSLKTLPVRLDDAQLVTALLNLIKNAIDAMPGNGELRIGTRQIVLDQPRWLIHGHSLDPGAYVAITVRDTGTGIPDEYLPQVVEPFFSTKPAGKGTGLGLSMVVGFAEGQGGGVDIKTSPEGTHIMLFLPLLVRGYVPAAASDTKVPDGGSETQNAARLSGVPAGE